MTLPAPIQAAPRSPPNCDVTDIDEPEREEGHRDLDSSDDQGIIAAESISIPDGVTIEPTADLTLVAQSSLDVAGWIKLPDQTTPGAPPINVTLVCFDGSVHVGGIVGGGHAAPGADATASGGSALATAEAGTNGGWIRIYAATVQVDGNVAGNGGGSGGNAEAEASGTFGLGHVAGAVGGGGGHGGDVLICATKSVKLRAGGGRLVGGAGGRGGDARANSSVHGEADALGGPGSNGGDVRVVGGGAGVLPVDNQGAVLAGTGGGGGTAHATGGVGWLVIEPSTADAHGGYAGDGGDVTWVNATPAGGGVIRSIGGPGGYAYATGGNGAYGFLVGGRGADANATGGNGGSPGNVGGRVGNGGDATAQGGDGGDAMLSLGGASGTGVAQGGEDGIGSPPGPPVTAWPVAGTPKKGGAATKAFQAGA